jgi:hypothetical protein
VKHFRDDLHVSYLVREEFEHSFVPTHFAQVRKDDEQRSHIIADFVVRGHNLFTNVELHELHDRCDEWFKDRVKDAARLLVLFKLKQIR